MLPFMGTSIPRVFVTLFPNGHDSSKTLNQMQIDRNTRNGGYDLKLQISVEDEPFENCKNTVFEYGDYYSHMETAFCVPQFPFTDAPLNQESTPKNLFLLWYFENVL